MNNEKYTHLEIGILLFFLLNSFTSLIIMKSFSNKSSLTIVLSILTALILGIPLLMLLFRQWKDDFLNNICNNKVLSFIFKLIFIISSLSIALYSIFNLSIIIKDIILPNTNQKLIEFTFLILATILSLKGLKSISIATNLMFFFYLIVIVINFAFNLFNVEPINLLPLTLNVDKIDFYSILVLTISPIFLLLIIPKKEINNFSRTKKTMNIFYFIFFGFFIIKTLFILAILGEKYFAIVAYPEVEVLKMISIFNFFQRLEEILIISIFIENLVITSFSLNYLKEVSNSIYNLGNKVYFLIDIVIFIILLKLDVLNNYYLLVILSIFIILNLFTNTKRKKYKEKSRMLNLTS